MCIESVCTSLAEFLEKFPFFTPIVAGDTEALERVAYEFVEDQAIQGVIYTETRYSPHLLTADKLTPAEARFLFIKIEEFFCILNVTFYRWLKRLIVGFDVVCKNLALTFEQYCVVFETVLNGKLRLMKETLAL